MAVIASAGLIGHGARAASSCADWGNQTVKRADQARLLLEPKELGGQSTGSAQGDARALLQLAQDQAKTDPLKSGRKLNIRLEVIRLSEAERGFVSLPRRRVVGQSFAWAAHFRRPARDYGRVPETVAGSHFVAFARPMAHQMPALAATIP